MKNLKTITPVFVMILGLVPLRRTVGQMPTGKEPAKETKEFEIRRDRPYLGGQPIEMWGLRAATPSTTRPSPSGISTISIT